MQKNDIEAPLVLTLDAGGTNFTFSAIKDGLQVGRLVHVPANAHDLELCIAGLIEGFRKVINSCEQTASAISFAFPGPADYKNGIIGDLPNLPAFRNGVPLGPILEDQFGIPVFINNDGDLFTLGEAKDGFLPQVNSVLEEAGSPRRYKNLIGITLGTGFGVGITLNGEVLAGDNSAAAEGWKLRNKQLNYTFIEDTVSPRALKQMYAQQIAIDSAKAPEPKELYEIAIGKREGVREAAREAFYKYGEAVGDAISSIVTLVDGLVVIGGGVSGAYPLLSGVILDEMNGFFDLLSGERMPRLIQKTYDWEQPYSRSRFLKIDAEMVNVPGSDRKVEYQKEKKTAIGVSKLGTSQAIMKGAYYFALNRLQK